MSKKVERSFYVYRINDGHETVYIGKGSGRRLENQIRAFGLSGEVVEECTSDDHAFEREVYWIKHLMPTFNKVAGGNGGRCRPKELTATEKKSAREYKAFLREYNEIGPRRYVARFLCRKLNLTNCEENGVSKVGWFRLKEVADGEWC